MTRATSGDVDDTRSFYDAAPLEPHLLYQGEILVDVPLMTMPKASRWLLLRTKSGTPVEEALGRGDNPRLIKVLDSNQTALNWAGADGDYVMARLSKRPVLVLSQTCDIETKEFIAVAPLHPVVDISPEQRESLVNGEVFDAFYMADHPLLPESFGDFSQIQAVHKSYIVRLSEGQHFRLSSGNVRALQQRITRFFGRPNSYDARYDKAPRGGTYLCISCFYLSGVVSSHTASTGERLPHCACGGFQWVRKSGPETTSIANEPNATGAN